MMGRTAVVIVTRNKQETLLRCVASALRLRGPLTKVVVVDNASTDGSADALARAFPEVTLVRNAKNLGPAGGRNAGWRCLGSEEAAEYLLFFDDDSIPTPDYLTTLLEAAALDHDAGIVCGKGYTKFPSRTIMSVGVTVSLWTGRISDIGVGERDVGQFDAPRYVDACGGFGMLVRRDTLEALDGFDERFWPYGWEDVDLCLRARQHGCRTLYVPDAVVYHEGGKIGRKPVAAYERSKIKNYFLLLRCHATLSQKVACVICAPLRALGLLVTLVMQGQARIVGAHLHGLVDAIQALRVREFAGSTRQPANPKTGGP